MAFIFSSILDVIGISLIGIFLAFITNMDVFFQKFHFLGNVFGNLTEKQIIVCSGLFIIAAFIIKAYVALRIQTQIVFFSLGLSVRLKTRLMMAYQIAPFEYHLQKNSAYLVTRMQDNINNYINNLLMPILNVISNGIVIFFILISLAIMRPLPTIFLGAMFLTLGTSYDWYAKKKLAKAGKIVAELNGELVKNINHGLHGLNEIRVLGRENYFLSQLTKISRQYAQNYGLLTALQQVPRYLIENIMAMFIVGIGLIGIFAGYSVGVIVATAGMFAAAGVRLLPTVNQFLTGLNQIRGSSYHMQLIYDELTEVDKLSNKAFLVNDGEKYPFSNIILQNVTYQYPRAHRLVLTNITMSIKKGQSIGLVGASGAGKSTLINIILGFIEPSQGCLLIDGKPRSDLRKWLNNFAYIPQSIFLLDDTLQRNIALGMEDHEIDAEKIFKTIEMAQLNEVVNELPLGLNTIIGENGIRLSGGQRQRVALARALYHERDIIIMDEATSSLDNETEKEVINTIKRLKGNKTLIVIAHRLSTVEHCDILYKLEKGEIVAAGSFHTVIGRPITV